MAASVALLGWDEDPIRVVQDVDWTLDDRADSTNQLRVTTSLAEAYGVDAEQEVIFKSRRFTVVDVDRDRAQDRAVIVADEAQAALADVVIVDFKPNNWSLTRAMNAVLADTRWSLGEVNGVRYGQAHFDEITALDALHFLARHQDAELSFDSLRRRVNITGDRGRTFEYVFTYGRQLSNIEKSVRAPVTTAIYPTMAEDVELPVVEDYGYYLSQGLALSEAKARFRKEEYWEDSRYEIAENMTRDAEKRLEEEAWPRITYTLTAQATLDVEGVDDFDLAELRLGDTVYVWDQEIDAKLSATVTAVTTSSDQSQNELTLSTLPASLGDTVSGRGYFGDSGRPSDGNRRRSGPQPRPSMPILEDMTDYGVVDVRWNGQDHAGNYETIPQRFGRLFPIVAPLEADGSIPSPNGESAFTGSDIITRGGGISMIGMTGYGEFAVWFQMEGWDYITRSELSEPLVIDVPPVFDPGPLQDSLADLNENRLPALRDRLDTIEPVIADYDDRIQSAQDGAQSARDTAENLRDNVLPPLQGELVDLTETRLPAVESTLSETRLGMENLRDIRLPELETHLNSKASSSELDAISNGVAALSGTNARTWIQDEEPPAPTGAVTYEWAGTPHASESVKRVDGVEVQRNPLTNPSFETGTALGFVGDNALIRRATGANFTTRGQYSLAIDFDGTATASRFTVTLQESIVVEPGQWVAFAAYTREASGSSLYVWPVFNRRTEDDTHINYVRPEGFYRLSPSGMSGAARRVHVYQVPEGTYRMRLGYEYSSSGDNWAAPIAGATAYTDAQIAATAATEAQARAKVETYFDGDTPSALPESGIWINTAENDARYWWDHEQGAWVEVTDDAVFGRVVADRIFANLGVFDRLDAREGWIGGVALEDGAVDARHIMAESIAGAVGEFLQLTAENIDTEGLAAYLATIIELDAGQITAGKISTSRLDAEEVAGAVANFLTLDALEINVEQLAGEIANIIEVTAESIQAGAIGTRHLAIADFENLMPQEAIENLAANGDNTSPWIRVRGNTDRWHTVTGQGRGMRAIRINDGTSANVRTTLEYSPGAGLGVPVSAGDSLRLTFYGWAGGTGAAPVISLLVRDADGSFVGRANSVSAQSGWHEYALEIHNADEQLRYLRVEFDVPAGVAMRGHWQDFKLRRMENGELLVDGGIKARHLDVEEIFFDQAVGNTVAAGVGEFLELNADQIRSNSWTGITATGATFQTHAQADRGVKLQPQGLHGWDSNGAQTMRLNGTNNYLRGSLHAGLQAGSEVHIDYGQKTRTANSEDGAGSWQIETPYIDFRGSYSYQFNRHPSIYIDEGTSYAGMMFINPGYPSGTNDYRGVLNIGGDIAVNRADIRGYAESWSGYRLPRSSNQPGGLTMDDSLRTRLRGRTAASHGPHDMIVTGTSTDTTLQPRGIFRGTLTFGSPAETGVRRTIASSHVADTNFGYDNYSTSIVSTAATSASTFRFVIRAPEENTGSVQTWVYYQAIWV